MRNGNIGRITFKYPPIFEFLPYLWGMETIQILEIRHYRLSSYRTYEEWKLLDETNITILKNRSYRTYEEWKLESLELSEDWHYSVLTVPMRNGNIFAFQIYKFVNRFLPYLWGMETLGMYKTTSMQLGFLPYLWGMETRFRCSIPEFYNGFLPYLWGMETWFLVCLLLLQLWVLTVPMRNGNHL